MFKINYEKAYLVQFIGLKNYNYQYDGIENYTLEVIKTVFVGPKETVSSIGWKLYNRELITFADQNKKYTLLKKYQDTKIRTFSLQKGLYATVVYCPNILKTNLVKEKDYEKLYHILKKIYDIPLAYDWMPMLWEYLKEENYLKETFNYGMPEKRNYYYLDVDDILISTLNDFIFKHIDFFCQKAEKQVNKYKIKVVKDESTNSLATFVKGAKEQLTDKIKEKLCPSYDPQKKHDIILKIEKECSKLGKTPFPAQQDVINALVNGYFKLKKRALLLTAEMGCGKTLMGIATSYALSRLKGKYFRTLIVCPPTLINTWIEEIQSLFGKDGANIINLNGPDALQKLINIRKNRKIQPDKPTFYISGWNRMKTHFTWENVIIKNRLKSALCVHCGVDLTWHTIKKTKKIFCPECEEPLWQATVKGASPKYAPVLYIKKYLKNYFDFLLVDEVHQLKGENTIQGAMLGQLASCCKYILCLTGTLSGGKASDIFYLLQRAIALNYSKEERAQTFPAYHAKIDFCSAYGTIEETIRYSDDYYSKTGRNYSRRVTIKEKPGISPLVIKQFFIENTAFLRLSDIAEALPPFREEIEFCELPQELFYEYSRFEAELTDAVTCALKKGDMTVLGQMLSSLLAWPDFPQKECKVYDKEGNVVAVAPAFEIDKTPKDERLIEIVREAKRKGRKCLVFVEYTGKWNGDVHVAKILKENGLNPLVMKSNTVNASQRLDWIRQQMEKNDYDCLICQPKLVEVGLNLIDFPEIIFYQTGYSIYVLRQASRRSYRPGQKQEVVVRYLINKYTIQEKAMTLIASKLEASLVLEGELSDKGLVTLSDMGDNLAVELARSLVGEVKLDSLESQFAAYKQMEMEVDNNIDDDTSVELETVTTTTIQKGKRKVEFKIRSKKIVGLLQRVGANRFVGKIKGKKIHIRNGKVYYNQKNVGTLDEKELKIKWDQEELILKRNATLLDFCSCAQQGIGEEYLVLAA